MWSTFCFVINLILGHRLCHLWVLVQHFHQEVLWCVQLKPGLLCRHLWDHCQLGWLSVRSKWEQNNFEFWRNDIIRLFDSNSHCCCWHYSLFCHDSFFKVNQPHFSVSIKSFRNFAGLSMPDCCNGTNSKCHLCGRCNFSNGLCDWNCHRRKTSNSIRQFKLGLAVKVLCDRILIA